MGFRINSNIAALNAQRHLSNISNKLDKSLERLSSGLRINKASDDASGMATSVYLRSQIGGLLQASRNANDAISMTQTAEGALDVTTNILLRLRELAVQSATDTTNRTLLIEEANQLVAELTRVATDTEFVGNTLLNGSFQSGVIQVGANQGQTISFSIGDVRAAALGERATTTIALEAGTAEGGFDYGEFTINATNVAATQSSDDQVSVLDLVGSGAARNLTMTHTGASTRSSGAIGANSVYITNGFSVANLTVANASAGSIAAAINALGMAGITASDLGVSVGINVTSGYDVGFMVSGTMTAASLIDRLGISLVGSDSFVVEVNDGGAAKISGLTINGETIATVSLAQGAGVVSGLTASGSRLVGMDSISNNDAAFLTAMIAAVNAQTNLTNVTARAGSATTMLQTLVLTADDGKDIEIGATGLTQASFYNATGLASAYYAQAADTTTYNGQSSAMAKVAAIDAIKSISEVDAMVAATVVTGTAAIGVIGIDAGDLYVNGINIGAVTVLANDSSYALTAAINAKSTTTGVVASINTSSQMVLTASDGRNISIVAASDVATALNITSTVTRGSVTLNSNDNFIIAGTTDDFGGVTGIAGTYTTSLDNPVSLLDLSTQIGADSALATLDAAVTQVNTVRSQLGAIQSRISLTIINLTTTAENLSASDSRIKDVDFAEETSVFTKNSILTQAATAILAQANQLPQLALQLLG